MQAIVLHDRYPSCLNHPQEWLIAATFAIPAGQVCPPVPNLLDYLFQCTTSIDSHWAEAAHANTDCILTPKDSLRSTSTGDVILVKTGAEMKAFYCGHVGWKTLDIETTQTILQAVSALENSQRDLIHVSPNSRKI